MYSRSKVQQISFKWRNILMQMGSRKEVDKMRQFNQNQESQITINLNGVRPSLTHDYCCDDLVITR